jgi:hypothetical protein
MATLRTHCLEFLRKNNKNILRDAYEDPDLEIPFEQIEPQLFDQICKYLNNDYKGVVRLIQIEKELMIKIAAEEEGNGDDQLFEARSKVLDFC